MLMVDGPFAEVRLLVTQGGADGRGSRLALCAWRFVPAAGEAARLR
jgi:hypothetical protein